MKKLALTFIAGFALALSACSTSTPSPPATSAAAVTVPAAVSSVPSPPAPPAPASSAAVLTPASATPAAAAKPAPSRRCVRATRKNLSYTITGNVVKIVVKGTLCRPLFIRVQNWRYTAAHAYYPQIQASARNLAILETTTFTLPRLVSQQDIYASTSNNLARTTPSVLKKGGKREPAFLSKYASGPKPFRVRPVR